MDMIEHWVFAYGTLQDAEVLRRVMGRCPPLAAAWLTGYARFRFVDASYPGIVEQAGARVAGQLCGPITPAELRLLDVYEGDRYERVACHVELIAAEGAHGQVPAWVYVVRAPFRALLDSQPWDFESWQQRDRAAFLAQL